MSPPANNVDPGVQFEEDTARIEWIAGELDRLHLEHGRLTKGFEDISDQAKNALASGTVPIGLLQRLAELEAQLRENEQDLAASLNDALGALD